MIDFQLKHPAATHDMLGYIPAFLSLSDPRTAREQLHENYSHGGGWCPFIGHTMSPDGATLTYPGDPPLRLMAEATLRDEVIRIYEFAWVLILQPDGSYEIVRMD